MWIKTFLAAAAFAGTASPALAQQSRPYHMVGTEPFWSATIAGPRMEYSDAEGVRMRVATPRPTGPRTRQRFHTRRLTITLLRGRECSDGMSDNLYPDTVEVIANGRRLSGCGGTPLPPATLEGTQWQIVSINGRNVPSTTGGYQLSFTADQISGSAGCNRFNGSYRVSTDGFQAGPLAMTRRLCPGEAMTHERAVAEILGGRVRLFYPEGNILVMRGVDGGEIRLRRVI